MRFARLLILSAVLALVAAPAALALRFTDDSYLTPRGVVGQAYTHWFKGDGGCGPALPYQFTVVGGSLPPGLSLRKDGLVSGAPTQAGSWSFWVELSDQDPPSASWCVPAKSQREFTITVDGASPTPPPPPPPPPPAPALAITTSSAPGGMVGVSYSLGLTASGGGTQTWSVTADTLPPGLALSSATGALTGTPTAAGDYTFTVQVRDGSRSGSKQLTISVAPALTIATQAAPPGTVGIPYTLGLTANGGGTQAWSISAGTLPPGLTLNPTSGAVTGTPTAAGDFTFTVQVRDGARASSKQLTIAVRNRVAITTPRVPRAEVGVELKPLKLVATGGTGTYAWKLESGSAPGLSFDPATAELTGTPTTAGSFPLKVSATDGDSRTATVDVTVRVSAELTILTESLRPGRVGRLYSATLASYGGVGPLKWKVVEGRFPVGIRLNRSTGAVFGTPRHAGIYELTFKATDALGVTREVTLRLRVLKTRAR